MAPAQWRQELMEYRAEIAYRLSARDAPEQSMAAGVPAGLDPHEAQELSRDLWLVARWLTADDRCRSDCRRCGARPKLSL